MTNLYRGIRRRLSGSGLCDYGDVMIIIITLVLSVDAVLKNNLCIYIPPHCIFQLIFTRADASKQPDISWIEIV